MIAYIKGEITFKSADKLIIEAAGVGYYIHITTRTYAQVEKLERAKVLTYQHIKEDSHTLYGFADAGERQLFMHLISVSGIGPGTAQQMLSAMGSEELRAAILSDNEATLRSIKGIGGKTAKRIILDLKDKLQKSSGESFVAPVANAAGNSLRQEALMALESLGIHKIRAQKALNQVLKNQPSFQQAGDLVREALKLLG